MSILNTGLEDSIMMHTLKALFITVAILSCPLSYAETDGHGGDGFRKTAIEYDAKYEMYRDKENMEIADAYHRLAEIKRNAGKLADENKWDDIDWTEYHQINAKIERMPHSK